jgi:hypothetical protein
LLYEKGEKEIQPILNENNLYVIAQRAELSYKNVVCDDKKQLLQFNLTQEGKDEILKCNVPYIKEFDGVKFMKGSGVKDFVDNARFLFFMDCNYNQFLFTPEQFILNVHNGIIKADIEGNYREFLKYKVHYVGKATEQDILKRLTGHSKLQRILTLETPFTYGSLPAHEITLLLFKFFDNLDIRIGINNDEFCEMMQGKDIPTQETIYSDAEKALIKVLNPKGYNEKLYPNYPKSADGLYNNNYDTISYTLQDPITLLYEKGEIVGGIDEWGGDIVRISNNKIVEIVKR